MDGVSSENGKSFLEKLLGDISKSSATKQIVIGSTSGFITGLVSMKIGKTFALAVGGGIILLEIAHEQGYVKINWDKVNKKIDKVTDKVEEKIAGEGPSWIDKMERYVDRKIDKAEDKLKRHGKSAKRWYDSYIGKSGYELKESHIFIISFLAGISIGIAAS